MWNCKLFDSKGSLQEAINALKVATDQGFRYIAQGNSSEIASALIDAISKYHERNPGKELVFFNCTAVDPGLTNSRCCYWHFRFDVNTSMTMDSMTFFMKDDTLLIRKSRGLQVEPVSSVSRYT